MKDVVDAMSSFIEQTKNMQRQMPNKSEKKDKWLECIRLLKSGWKNISCYDVEEPSQEDSDEETFASNDIVFVWQKGEETKHVRLSFKEQVLWLAYLERNNEKNGEKNGEKKEE
jgi:hypothetical protein